LSTLGGEVLRVENAETVPRGANEVAHKFDIAADPLTGRNSAATLVDVSAETLQNTLKFLVCAVDSPVIVGSNSSGTR
jgi:hypothetical protein